MALPVNTLEMDEEKRKKKTNYPYVQDGNVLPMADVATVPQTPPQTPIQPVTTQPAATQPQVPTFTSEQAAALAQQPVYQPPAPPATPETSKQVLGEVQRKAVAGFKPEELNRLNELAQQFMQDPNLGRDPELAKKKAMDEFNEQRAQSFEAYRQATGGAAGIGPREESLLAMQLQTGAERAAFSRDIDIQEEEIKRKNLLEALAVGTQNVQLQQGIYQGDIDAMIASAGGALGFAELAQRENILLSEQEYDRWKTQYTGDLQTNLQKNDINAVRQNLQTQLDFEKQQAALGRQFTGEQNAFNRALEEGLAHLDIDAQREFIGLKAEIDKGTLLATQDFAATEAQLDRLLEKAIAEDNIEAQYAIQESQNQFASLMQESEQRWKTAERTATEVFVREERVSEEAFSNRMADIQNRHQLAMQSNDITAQKEIEAERRNLQLTMLTQEQNFSEAQNFLDRELSQAMQVEDIGAQKDIEKMKADLQLTIQQNDQKFTDAQQYLQRQHEAALQADDITAQKDIKQMQVDLELTMQTQGMAHDERMRYLDSELQEARDQENFIREKQLMIHQTELNWQTMEIEQGYDAALMNLQSEIDIALQNDQQEFAYDLEVMRWEKEMEMHQDNIEIQQAKLTLEQQGLDMAAIEQQYNMIMDQVAQGTAEPGEALAYLNDQITQAGGVPIEKADPMAWQQSIQEDFLMQQYQWALTQGDLNEVAILGTEGEFEGLKPEYMQQFNGHLNETIYGTDETPMGQVVSEFKKGETDAVTYFSGKDSSDPAYQKLLSDNSTVKWDGHTEIVGKRSSKRRVYVNMPQVGGFLNKDGNVYRLDNKRTDKVAGTNWKEYKMTNILTGESFWISTAESENRWL